MYETMYDTSSVLEVLDGLPMAFLISGGLLFAGFYSYYIECIRIGRKQETFATPVLGNMFNTAHDLVFIAMFSYWFFTVDHIIFKLFWVGLVIYTGLEVVVHIQTLAHGRRELAPTLTQTQFVWSYILAQVGVIVLFLFLMSLLPSDDLFLVKFSLAVICNVISGLVFNHKRQGRGSSRAQAFALLVGSSAMFFGFLPTLSPYFTSNYYYAMGSAVVIAAFINVIITLSATASPQHRERAGHSLG